MSTNSPVVIDEYVDEKTMAARIGCSRKHLENMRHRGIGPNFYKFSHLIRYRVAEVMEWATTCRASNTAQGIALKKKARNKAAGLLNEGEAAIG